MIDAILLPGARHGMGSTWLRVGDFDINKIEELSLPGPGGAIPYIRVHLDSGSYNDHPKHQLLGINYRP